MKKAMVIVEGWSERYKMKPIVSGCLGEDKVVGRNEWSSVVRGFEHDRWGERNQNR